MNNKIDFNEISIETAKNSDIESLYLLNKKLIDDYEDIKKINYEKVLEWVKKNITNNINIFNVIFYQKEKVGYFSFAKIEKGFELDSLFVFEKFQKQGIATYIINECIKKTDEDIYLYVFKNNKAFNLYQKMGFRIVEEIFQNRYLMVYKNNKV